MITLPQPDVTFPNVMQLGGRLQAPLLLATSDQTTYAMAVDGAMEVLEFYHGDRTAIGPLPGSFREVGPFAQRLFTEIKMPLTKSVMALAEYPAPCRVRAEGVRDDIVLDCANRGIIVPSAADKLITSASIYLYVLDMPCMGNQTWGVTSRMDIAGKLWVGNIRSGQEMDMARSLLVGYEITRPERRGSASDTRTSGGTLFMRALRSSLEADLLRQVVDDKGKKGPILRDMKPERLRAMLDKGMLTQYTYDTVTSAIRQRSARRPQSTIRLKVPYELPELTQKERTELELIYRMHLAMKIWVGNFKFSAEEQAEADALLAEYGIYQPEAMTGVRTHFLDALRGAVEADMLREIINDAGVIQFIQPRLLQTMLDMGMLTRQTYITVYDAVERRRNAINTRDTVKIRKFPSTR